MSSYGQVLPGIDAMLIRRRGRKELKRDRDIEVVPLRIVAGHDWWERRAALKRGEAA